MGLFDFFKKKRKPDQPMVGQPKAGKKKIEKKPVVAKALVDKDVKKKKADARPLPKVKPVLTRRGRPKKETSKIAYRVLGAPHVTEKATALTEENKYVFKVLPRTNKIEIKKAVEDLYGVDVVKVRIINVPKRRRRLGKQKGWRKGYKKAIVKIKKGQKIEILPR